MRGVFQGLAALLILVWVGFADGLMDGLGVLGFAAVSLLCLAIAGLLVLVSWLFEDKFYSRW